MTTTTDTPTSETEFEERLLDAVNEATELVDPADWTDAADAGAALAEIFAGGRADSFADAGVLTRNAGVVVRLANGAEFQITIVQSQEATR